MVRKAYGSKLQKENMRRMKVEKRGTKVKTVKKEGRKIKKCRTKSESRTLPESKSLRIMKFKSRTRYKKKIIL